MAVAWKIGCAREESHASSSPVLGYIRYCEIGRIMVELHARTPYRAAVSLIHSLPVIQIDQRELART